MFGWIALIVDKDFLDLGGGAGPAPKSTADRLALFDKSVADARRALSGATDEHLSKPWQLRVGGKVVDDAGRVIPRNQRS